MTWAGREVDTDWDHCERERAVEEWTQAEDRKRIQWEREQRREEREWTRERLAWVPLSGSAHLSLYTGKVA